MFFTVRKSDLIRGIPAAVAVIVAVLIIVRLETSEYIPTNADTAGHIIVIDPGHGGPDGGASSDNTLEKDLNLDVGLKLRDIITSDGNTAVMTRESDEVALNENGNYAKKTDLDHRLSFIDSSNAEIFVSIHMNKFGDSKYSGAQVFYSSSGDESRKLGEYIQASLKVNLDPENTRTAKNNETGIYILKNANVPAVIVECGFLSNPDELERLNDDEYRLSLSKAIYEGIKKYYGDTE